MIFFNFHILIATIIFITNDIISDLIIFIS